MHTPRLMLKQEKSALEFELRLLAACRGFQMTVDIPALDFVSFRLMGMDFVGYTAAEARQAVRSLRYVAMV